ncbi:hypothetical protein BB560_006479, partial [Smittium megazygosporum]
MQPSKQKKKGKASQLDLAKPPKPVFHEGHLQVCIIQAKNLPLSERFTKKDLCVELTVGNAKKTTLTTNKGGYNPIWKDTVHFKIAGIGKSSMLLRVKEGGKITSDELCSCAIDLTRVFEDEEFDGWYPLLKRDKAAGFIYLEFTFTPA